MYYNELDKITAMHLNIDEIQNMNTNTTISDRLTTRELYHLDKKPSVEWFRNRQVAVYTFQTVNAEPNGNYIFVDVYFKTSIKNREVVISNKIVTVNVF